VELGIIGLGKMGSNMARRLSRGGHRVIGHNRSDEITRALAEEEENFQGAASLAEVLEGLSAPRAIWVMVPAGGPTEEVTQQLMESLQPGDTIAVEIEDIGDSIR